MAKYEQFVPPQLYPPTKNPHNHAIYWQISFKFCRCSWYEVTTIWIKFQENWREYPDKNWKGCPTGAATQGVLRTSCISPFLRIDTEWPVRLVLFMSQLEVCKPIKGEIQDFLRTPWVSTPVTLSQRNTWRWSGKTKSCLLWCIPVFLNPEDYRLKLVCQWVWVSPHVHSN